MKTLVIEHLTPAHGDIRTEEGFTPGDPMFIPRSDFIQVKHNADKQDVVRQGRVWRAHSPFALGLHIMSWGEAEVGQSIMVDILMEKGWPYPTLIGDDVEYDETLSPGHVEYTLKQGKDEYVLGRIKTLLTLPEVSNE